MLLFSYFIYVIVPTLLQINCLLNRKNLWTKDNIVEHFSLSMKLTKLENEASETMVCDRVIALWLRRSSRRSGVGNTAKGTSVKEEEASSCAFCFAWPLAGESPTCVRTRLTPSISTVYIVRQRRLVLFFRILKKDHIIQRTNKQDEEVRTKADTRLGEISKAIEFEQNRIKNNLLAL